MTRFASILLLIAFAASPLAVLARTDPVFSQVPFDQWLSEGDRSHMRWNVRLSEPALSTHQRLFAGVYVSVDGAELARRRGKGQFLVLVQLNDEKGRVFQNHQEMELSHIEEGMKINDAVFSQLVFLLPGDYRVAIAIFDNATGEHGLVKRKLHVSPLKGDPLPGAWRDLPAVEFVEPSMPPDGWYLPSIQARLRLAVKTHEPVHVDLVVNLTPSEQLAGSTRVRNRDFGMLLPATKVFSQVDWGDATFSLALLDLARRRVTYHQEIMPGLDWTKAGSALAGVEPGIIDVKSLENRQYSAAFFLDEIRRRIAVIQPGPRRSKVVIILSSAVQFVSGQEVRPIAIDGPTDAKLFYIRYQPPPRIFVGPPGRRANFGPQLDQLEPLLKPLEPRLFVVSAPEQFRKALATILAEIAKL